MIPHGHLNGRGELETNEAGYIRLCYDGVCVEWHTRNAKALNSVGGGLIGAFGGAIIGGLVNGRRGAEAGAVVGAALGGGLGYASSKAPAIAGYIGSVPILPPDHRRRIGGGPPRLPGRRPNATDAGL
jgi:hypothetical protein